MALSPRYTPEGASILNPSDNPFDAGAFLSKEGEGRSLSKYGQKGVVFAQGAAADSVFYIQKGKVKVAVCSELGKEAVVAILGKNEFFGEACLAGQRRRAATVTAITECEIMQIEKATIARAIDHERTLSAIFTDYLLARTIRVEEDLVDQLFNSSEKRLARALLTLASFDKEGPPDTVIAKVSQETLAEMIGTTRARVSFFMNKFRKLGYIDYNGKLEIHKTLLNFLLNEQPPHIEKKTSGSSARKRRARA